MPQLPTYESKQSATTQLPVTTEPAVQRYGAEKAYEGTKTILRAADEVLTAWQKAQDTIDYTNYTASKEVAYTKALLDATADPNPENAPKYQAAIENYNKTALDGFHNAELKQRVAIELERDKNITNLKIGALFQKKKVIEGKENLKKSLELWEKKVYAGLMTQEEALARSNALIADGVNGNLISKDVGKYAQEDFKEILRVGVPTNDMYANPAGFLDNINNYSLTNEEKTDLEAKAKAQLKKQVEQNKIFNLESQITEQADFESRLDGMPVPDALKELTNKAYSGQFDESWAKSMKSALLSTVGINQTMMNEFEAQMIIKADDLTARYQVKEKKKRKRPEAKEYLEGIINLKTEINRGKARGLVTPSMYKALMDKINNTNLAEATGKVAKTGWFMKYDSADAYKMFDKQLPIEDTYRAVRDFFEETHDKKLKTPEGQKIASDIITKIKTENRDDVLADNDLKIDKTAEIPSFATEAEAEKANLPIGSIVIIGGNKFRVKP